MFHHDDLNNIEKTSLLIQREFKSKANQHTRTNKRETENIITRSPYAHTDVIAKRWQIDNKIPLHARGHRSALRLSRDRHDAAYVERIKLACIEF